MPKALKYVISRLDPNTISRKSKAIFAQPDRFTTLLVAVIFIAISGVTLTLAFIEQTRQRQVSLADAPGIGGLWLHNGVLIETNAELVSSGARAVPDGSGGIIFAFKAYDVPEIFVQRIDSDGEPQWGSGGVFVGDQQTFGAFYEMDSDGAGGVIVAFEQEDEMTFIDDIYAQRVNSTGTAVWTAGGVKVSDASATDIISKPDILGDNGGAIVTWANNPWQ